MPDTGWQVGIDIGGTFTDLVALLPMAERRQIADDYKKIAGFDPQALNDRASFDPPSSAARAP